MSSTTISSKKKKETSEKKNRDILRQNKAHSVVAATVYSQICGYGIDVILERLCQTRDSNTTPPTCETTTKHMIDIMKVCRDALQVSSNTYMRCSTHIKLGASEIANSENSVLKKAIRFKEYDELDQDMDHYEVKMLQMHKVISTLVTIPAQIATDNTISTEIDKDNNDHSDDCMEIEETIHPDTNPIPNPNPVLLSRINNTTPYSTPTIYHSITPFHSRNKWFKLPPPSQSGHFYLPIEALSIILQLADNRNRLVCDLPPIKDTGRLKTRRISENFVISLMIMKAYLPVNKTTMYAIIKEFRNHGRLKFKYWRQRNKTGPKPLLKRSSLTAMVKEYEKVGDGGLASSRANLEDSINKKVKTDWLDCDTVRQKKDDLPSTSMNRMVNKVMALKAFNILTNVSNKTKSRTAAEFSVRSTVSYMMVVLTTHFVNAKPSLFHSRHKEVTKNPLYQLLQKLNKSTLGIKLNEDQLEALTYILPNLITSTDECSLFISSQKIHNKISWYFSVRPNEHSSPKIDSGRRDNYTTDLHGDAHLRGLRVSLNNTFTAGGQCAPIFACVFGMKATEMPRDEIVVCRVKGLVAASNVNGSTDDGFVVFIRGKYERTDDAEPSNQHSPESEDPTQKDQTITLSKESRVAKIYRDNVYYPFIKKIRIDHYEMDETQEGVPENLTAVSWMDGCHGQLKLTTTEDVMKTEKELKIITNKHSAARTAVEQAADVGPMFKMMKAVIKKMSPSNSETSAVYYRLTREIENLQDTSDVNNGRVVLLPLHKKQSIIVGLSKLPIAMSTACTTEIIQSAFRDNGQLDGDNGVIPNIKNLLGTYRGSIGDDHYLKQGEKIIKTFYKETYMKGRIEESSFDNAKIDHDRDRVGNIITRDFGISKENCQRAKILSCETQRQARLDLRKSILKKEGEKRILLHTQESKKYELNRICEERVMDTYYKTIDNNPNQSQLISENRPTFHSMTSLFNHTHFGRHKIKGLSNSKPNCDHLKAFIQVRQKIVSLKGGAPVYKSLQKLNKDSLLDMCVESMSKTVQKRHFRQQSNVQKQNET